MREPVNYDNDDDDEDDDVTNDDGNDNDFMCPKICFL